MNMNGIDILKTLGTDVAYGTNGRVSQEVYDSVYDLVVYSVRNLIDDRIWDSLNRVIYYAVDATINKYEWD